MIFPVSVRNMPVISVSSLVMLWGDCSTTCKEWFMADEIWLASSSALIAGTTPDRKSVNTACKSECCASMSMCLCTANWSPANHTKWTRWSGSGSHFYIHCQAHNDLIGDNTSCSLRFKLMEDYYNINLYELHYSLTNVKNNVTCSQAQLKRTNEELDLRVGVNPNEKSSWVFKVRIKWDEYHAHCSSLLSSMSNDNSRSWWRQRWSRK